MYNFGSTYEEMYSLEETLQDISLTISQQINECKRAKLMKVQYIA